MSKTMSQTNLRLSDLRQLIREIVSEQLTREEALEYVQLDNEVSQKSQTPGSYIYHQRDAQNAENSKLVARMNFLIKKAGAKNLSDMDNIVANILQ